MNTNDMPRHELEAALSSTVADRDRWIARVKLLESRIEAAEQALHPNHLQRSNDPVGLSPRAHEEHVRAVVEFGAVMIAKLDKNAHKGHWSTCSVYYLLDRLNQERHELVLAVDSNDAEKIRDEAADVANFAMMIADNYRR